MRPHSTPTSQPVRRHHTLGTLLATMSTVSNGVPGAAMKCLACGAEMRLMDVQTDTTTVCGIERHTFRCSTCPQTAQRLMFNRPRMPIIHLPVVTRPKAIDLQMGRPAAGSGWVNAVEKLNSKQADLKQRTAMTVRTPDWGSAVEKVSIALKQQAVSARAAAWARTVERLRSRQMALKERAVPVRTVDREFDRVWYGHCPDEAAPKPVALGPELVQDGGESSPQRSSVLSE